VKAFHGFLYGFGRRRYSPIVQVNELGRYGIGLLNIVPEVFIIGKVLRVCAAGMVQRALQVPAPGGLCQGGEEGACGKGA